jgi:hypothetical protein
MVFRNGGPLRTNEKWYFNGEKLEVVSGYKYLGAIWQPKPRKVFACCEGTTILVTGTGYQLIYSLNYLIL